LASTVNASNTGFGGVITTGDSSGQLQLQTAGTTAVTIDTSQNVGIGTTAPDALLHVNNASAKIRIGVTASSSYLDIYRDSTLGGSIYNAAQASPYGYHVWQTAGTERMRIDSNGYALIGYTSSNGAYKLQVNSQIFATSSTIATSDARYKTNIEPITSAIELVNKLNPVSFDWKEHPIHEFPEGKTIGFLAQEVQEVLKDTDYVDNIVKTNECVISPEEKDEDGNVTKEAVKEEFLGIAEGNLIPLLTKAIQEQQTIINDLKARIETLEAK